MCERFKMRTQEVPHRGRKKKGSGEGRSKASSRAKDEYQAHLANACESRITFENSRAGGSAKGRERPSFYGDYSDPVVNGYEMTMKCYLGHSYTVHSYKDELSRRSRHYSEARIENLYAIVVPGGHGKTYLSQKYGFLDVDDMVSQARADELASMRRYYVYSNTMEWQKHNELWYESIRETMTMMDFKRPVIICVHTEECALEIGAAILDVMVLNSEPFEDNIKRRSPEGKTFSRISREFVLNRSINDVRKFDSNEALEAWVVEMCNLYSIPIGAPYTFGSRVKNSYYADGLPKWVTRGWWHGRRADITKLVKWFHEGKIPKECVDYFVRRVTPKGKAYGFGITNNDWARMFAKIAANIPRQQRFNIDDDLFELFPPESQAEKHRVNVTLKRLKENTDMMENEWVRCIMGYHLGDRHVFVTGLVCHWWGLGRSMPFAKTLFPVYLTKFEEWNTIVGELHAMIRVSDWFFTTPITEDQRQSVMYMNMLTGRQMYEADWMKVYEERKDETGTDYVSFDPVRKVWSRGQYLVDFNEALAEAYLLLFSHPVEARVHSFQDFWVKRRSWVAKGSTVLSTLPKEMLKYNVVFHGLDGGPDQVMETRHNKKSLFESEQILNVLNETEETWNATKVVPKLNETGKKRELLPGTLLHYLIFSYVLYVAEKQKRIGSTRLNQNDDDNIQYYDRKMTDKLQHLLYDWADFNTQHSKEDMAKVISWLKNIPSAPEDYGLYCESIAESFYHMYLITDEGEKLKLEKGLFSGWRGTTWINTVLNYVYVAVGIRCCERIYGDFSIAYVDHGGDDLDIAFNQSEDTFRLLDVMDAIGFEAKDIKQMIDVKAEFYRNTITEEGVFASPTRAMANFVSGNWESSGAKTISEKTTSILDQVSKLIRRGVDAVFCNQLGVAALKHWLKIKVDDEWMKIRDEVIHGHPEDGGLGVPDKEGCLWRLEPKLDRELGLNLSFQVPGAYCTEDYIETVEEELSHLGIRLAKRKGLINKLALQSYDLEQFCERSMFKEINAQKVKVTGREPVVVRKWDERLFQDFLDWVNYEKGDMSLGKISQLEELIGHMVVNERVLSKEDLIVIFCDKHVNMDAVDFKGDVYYRRLVPDFLANLIDDYARWRGNEEFVEKEVIQEWFTTLCYMACRVYHHRS